jgi:uncharacterized membrane protein YkgB
MWEDERFQRLDYMIADWMYRYGRILLRYSLAVIFIWFGLLKSFGVSPAEDLVARTVYWLPPEIFVPVLGWWEFLIGAFLLFRRTIRAALGLLFLQMPGTALPLVLLPEVCFAGSPLVLTLEGQYIVKNLVLISAALVVGGAVRGRARAKQKTYV